MIKTKAAPAILTSAEICEPIGLPLRTLAEWVDAGVIEPAVLGKGRGKTHRWTGLQSHIIGFAALMRLAGYGGRSIRATIFMLSRMSEEEAMHWIRVSLLAEHAGDEVRRQGGITPLHGTTED